MLKLILPIALIMTRFCPWHSQLLPQLHSPSLVILGTALVITVDSALYPLLVELTTPSKVSKDKNNCIYYFSASTLSVHSACTL